MRIDTGIGRGGAVLRRSDHAPGLPKRVRLRGGGAAAEGSSSPQTGDYEFEVVTGSAAWREGERFYLTAAQALRAYFETGQGER